MLREHHLPFRVVKVCRGKCPIIQSPNLHQVDLLIAELFGHRRRNYG
jgi:hypothetical protein